MELLYRQSPPDFSNSPLENSLPPGVQDSSREKFNAPRKRGRNKFSQPPEPPRAESDSSSSDPE